MAQARQRPRARAGPAGPAPAGESPAGEPTHPVCTVTFCPICAVVTTVGDLRPEFVEHMLAAGREFLLAARTAIDARLDETERPRRKLERLTIE